MAISTKKRNLIIEDWDTGMYAKTELAKKYKVSRETVMKFILNKDEIVKKIVKGKSRSKKGTIYLIRAGDTDSYKIGLTTGDLFKRIHNIQTGNHLVLTLVDYVKCSEVGKKEKFLHDLFENNRTIGEWFVFNDISKVLKQFEAIRLTTNLKQH